MVKLFYEKRSNKSSAPSAVTGVPGVIGDAIIPPASVGLRSDKGYPVWSQFTRS